MTPINANLPLSGIVDNFSNFPSSKFDVAGFARLQVGSQDPEFDANPATTTRDEQTDLEIPNSRTHPPLAENEVQEVARQFESVFVSLLLKEMRQTLSEGLFGGDASDAFGGLFDMYMGQHLAESEALGIGQMVASQYRNAKQF